MEDAPANITHLLHDWRKGDKAALDALTPIVYQELRRLAKSSMQIERPGHTWQPTALIHEAYLRLIDQQLPDFQNRAHFFGVAAQTMRQLLIQHARSWRAQKRGGGQNVELEDDASIQAGDPEEILAVNEALDRLAEQDSRKAKVIEMRYFGGLEREEIAEVLGVSLGTVKRDIALGEAWLRRELERGEGDSCA